MSKIGNIIKSGVKWSAIAQMIIQTLKFGRWYLLVYLINPEYFGIAAIGLMIATLPGILIEEGTGNALLRIVNPKQDLLSSAFWFNIVFASLLGFVFIPIAYFASIFFDDVLIFYVSFIYILFFILESVTQVHHILLRKSLKFRFLAQVEVGSFLFSTVIAIFLAYHEYYWQAIVAQTTCSYVFSSILYVSKTKWYPSFHFKINDLTSLLVFSRNVIGFRLLTYFMRFVDDFLVTTVFGKTALGIYDRSHQLSHLPMRMISNRISSVLYPAYSSVQDEKEKINSVHTLIITISIVLYLPILAGFIIFSKSFANLFLPVAWIEVGNLVPIMAFGGIVRALSNNNVSLFMIYNKTDWLLRYGFFSRMLSISGILVGLFGGIEGICWGYSIGCLLGLIVEWHAIQKFGIQFSSIKKECWLPFIFCLFLTLLFISPTFATSLDVLSFFTKLFIFTIVIVIVYTFIYQRYFSEKSNISLKKMDNTSLRILFPVSLIVLLFASPTLLYYLTKFDFVRLFFSYIISFLLFSLPIFLFSFNMRIYYFIIFPIILIAPIFCYPVLVFNTEVDIQMIRLFFESSLHDKIGYLKILNPIWFFIFILYAAAAFYIIRKLPKKLSLKQSGFISLFSLISLLIFAAIPYENYPFKKRISILSGRFYPYKVFHRLNEVQDYFLINTKRDNAEIDYRGTLEVDTLMCPDREIHVFILGETARYDRFSVNGYKRKTTPRLDTLSNLVSFSKIYANGHCTTLSAPTILTGTTTLDYDNFYKKSSLLQEMQRKGFQDLWVGSKYSTGADAIDIFAKDASNIIIPEQTCCFDENSDYDEVLLNPLNSFLNTSEAKKIFVLMHLIGSHWKYGEHYPENYNQFKPSDKGLNVSIFEPNSEETFNNGYDNTILYTDFIIGSVINIIKEKSAASVVYYTSDHGENLFDDDRGLFVHVNSTRYTHHIPSLIWFSKKYKNAFPSKVETIKNNKDKIALGENSFYTFLDLVNISMPKDSLYKSLASPNYHEPELLLMTEKGVKKYEDILYKKIIKK